MKKTVLSIGQCGFDHSSISNMLSSLGAKTIKADTASDARNFLKKEIPSLILINRIGDTDGANGHDFIRELKLNEVTKNIPVMLVSNYADAQSAAMKLGAIQGFGKSSIGSVQTLDLLRQALT